MVLANYETYLLSQVIHDWDDKHAIAILTRCHQTMKPQGKVLLVERVIQTGKPPELLLLESDVQMLVAPGEKERTEAEYRALLDDPLWLDEAAAIEAAHGVIYHS